MNIFFRLNLLFQSFLNILLCFIYIPKRGIIENAKKPKNNTSDITIFGNGPSLNIDIQLVESFGDNVMVVNSFVNSTFFKKIRPNYYIITDPGFFLKTEDKRLLNIQKQLISAISKDLSWEIQFIIPKKFYNSDTVIFLRKNKYVNVITYKDKPTIGGFEWINNHLYKFNFANPHYQNILIASIFLSMKLRFKKIIIYGADHSWHEDLYLSDNNILFRNDKHFNSNLTSRPLQIKLKNKSMDVSRQFDDLSRVFRTYHQIQNYASKNGVEIINKSSKTWIDAFKRD